MDIFPKELLEILAFQLNDPSDLNNYFTLCPQLDNQDFWYKYLEYNNKNKLIAKYLKPLSNAHYYLEKLYTVDNAQVLRRNKTNSYSCNIKALLHIEETKHVYKIISSCKFKLINPTTFMFNISDNYIRIYIHIFGATTIKKERIAKIPLWKDMELVIEEILYKQFM
jgi:hypothetical protein